MKNSEIDSWIESVWLVVRGATASVQSVLRKLNAVEDVRGLDEDAANELMGYCREYLEKVAGDAGMLPGLEEKLDWLKQELKREGDEE